MAINDWVAGASLLATVISTAAAWHSARSARATVDRQVAAELRALRRNLTEVAWMTHVEALRAHDVFESAQHSANTLAALTGNSDGSAHRERLQKLAEAAKTALEIQNQASTFARPGKDLDEEAISDVLPRLIARREQLRVLVEQWQQRTAEASVHIADIVRETRQRLP